MQHALKVILWRNEIDAGRAATLDLVLQTGPGAIAKKAFLALADLEHLLEPIETFPHRAGAGEWPEEPPSPIARARTTIGQRRVIRMLGQMDIRVRLIVPQQDIVRRMQGLNEVLLKQQCFCLTVGDRHLNRPDAADHSLILDGLATTAKIAGNAI